MAKKPVAAKVAAPPVAPAKVPEPVEVIDMTVTNCIPGTELSLSDGRKLAYGESAEVLESEKAFLIERGQVK